MSFILFNLTLKKNWKLFLIFFAVLAMYSGAMISMYNPEDIEKLLAMTEMFPAGILEAMNFTSGFSDLTGYMASWLYGFLMLAFPMVYSIILANSLVAKEVDSGSIVCLLTTPDSRIKIIATKAIYAVLSMIFLMSILCVMNLLICNALYPDYFNTERFVQLNITVTLVNLVVLGICFFFSCLFNTTKNSLAFGAGIPVAFILLNMLGGASDKADFLKKISIYGWYDPVEVAAGTSVWEINLVYGGMIVVLFTASVLMFRNRQLPV